MNMQDFCLENWEKQDYDSLCLYLDTLADPSYRAFHGKLVPGVENLLGIRVPVLRALAKEIAKGNVTSYFKQVKQTAYEEVMLYGMVIGVCRLPFEAVLQELDRFVPMIDNWAVCDVCCAGLKCTRRHLEEMYAHLQKYLHSEKEYELRFALVMLMDYYIDAAHIDEVLALYDSVRQEGYYVRMAVAWGLSVCFVKFREQTLAYLGRSRLDDFTYNKALQKIIESNRVSAADKMLMRQMKRR